MSRPDRLEVWQDNKMIAMVDSSHQPNTGDYLNFLGQSYKVISRWYNIDHYDDFALTQVRCNINVIKVKTP